MSRRTIAETVAAGIFGQKTAEQKAAAAQAAREAEYEGRTLAGTAGVVGGAVAVGAVAAAGAAVGVGVAVSKGLFTATTVISEAAAALAKSKAVKYAGVGFDTDEVLPFAHLEAKRPGAPAAGAGK